MPCLCFFLLLLPRALWLPWVGPALGSQVGLMLLGPPSFGDVALVGSVRVGSQLDL